MIIGIDHIGLATHEPAALAGPLAALGLSHTDAGVALTYQVGCQFWSDPRRRTQPAVEIVSPLASDSTVTRHLATRGPGLHHVAFRVDQLDAEVNRLRREGFSSVDDRPHPGARPRMRVRFLYLRHPSSLLVELVEYAPA